MRNTFRYSLTLEEYVSYNKTVFKKGIMFISFFVIVFFGTQLLFFNTSNTKSRVIFLIELLIIAAAFAFTTIYVYKSGIRKKTIKQIGNDKMYFENREITITPEAIESRSLPEVNEAGIIGIYPYSIMNTIYETDDLFVFVLGTEAKLLPKRAIPPEMKEDVYSMIRNSRKCMKLK